jgi:DNA-binding IclR family transcriptional regulator
MQTIDQKILDYMKEHKKPVTITKITKHFIVSESAVKQALAKMVKEGIAEIVTHSKPFLYRLK